MKIFTGLVEVVFGLPFVNGSRVFHLISARRLCETVGGRCFTLFQLVASIVPDVRCINVFTYNSLRNKGDSLAAIVGDIEQSILGN